MAEIPLDWHMLVFANEESNCTGKKTGNLTQLASAEFHERDLASVKNFNGKNLPL